MLNDLQNALSQRSPHISENGTTRYIAPPMNRRALLLSVLFLLVLACVAVAPGWLPGRMLGTSDSLLQFAPWSANPEYHPSNELLLDQPTQFLPWTYYATNRMKQAGHWVPPLWNPYAGCGQPFIANGQSAIFFPTFYLHLFLPPGWSWTISAALRLFWAGVGAWLLAGFYGLRPSSRLLVGSAFMLCGFNIVWLNHPHSNVSIFLPWTILLVERIICRPTIGRTAALAGIVGVQFLGGHPATNIHLLFVCGLVYLARLLWLDRGRFTGVLRSAPSLIMSVAIGFAIAGVQWIPLLEYVHNSGASEVRNATLGQHQTIPRTPDGKIDFAEIIGTWGELLGIVYPYANGYPPDGQTPFNIRAATKLPDTNELALGWCGLLTFMLAAVAVALRRREAQTKLMVFLALLCAAIAVKFPGLEFVVRHLPGLSVAQNGRLLLTTALMLSLLGGMGLDTLIDRLRAGASLPDNQVPRVFERWLKWLAIVALVASIFATGALTLLKDRMIHHAHEVIDNAQTQTEAYDQAKGKSHEYPVDHWYAQAEMIHTELVRTALRLLIPAALLGAGAALLRAHRRGHFWAASPIPWVGLILLDLLAFAVPYNPASPLSSYFAKDIPAIDFLRARLAGGNARFAGTYRSFIPETSTAYHLPDVRSYDAVAQYRRWLWKMSLDPGDRPDEYLSKIFHPQLVSWQLLSLRYLLIAPGQLDPGEPWKQVYPSPGQLVTDARIFENPNAFHRAWIVRSVRKLDSVDDVYKQVATFDTVTPSFDPKVESLVDTDGISETPGPEFWRQIATTEARPQVQFVEDEPERVRLHIVDSNGGWLILADNYFPGWHASIHDLEHDVNDSNAFIVPAFGTLRAVHLPTSHNVDVTFTYEPRSWRIGIGMSAIGLASLLLLLIASACIKMLSATPLPRASARPGHYR